MPITQRMINESTFLGLSIIIIISVLLSVAGLFIVRRFVCHHKLKSHNDIAGAIFQTLGVTYAVLLAFMVVVAWQNFERAGLIVETEANCLAVLVNNSYAFPKEFGENIRSSSQNYANKVVDDWRMLAEGKESPYAADALNQLLSLYTAYNPRTARENIFLSESLRKLNLLGEMRRIRIFEARQSIPGMLWALLIFGGIITVAFTFFFGSDNPRAQVLMSSLLAVLIALILYIIMSLDFPFTGSIRISPDAFKTMLQY